MSEMHKPEKVEPGQMWVDADRRSKGSGEFTVLKVIEDVDETYAVVKRSATGRVHRIRVSRLLDPKVTRRGYSYLGRGR